MIHVNFTVEEAKNFLGNKGYIFAEKDITLYEPGEKRGENSVIYYFAYKPGEVFPEDPELQKPFHLREVFARELVEDTKHLFVPPAPVITPPVEPFSYKSFADLDVQFPLWKGDNPEESRENAQKLKENWFDDPCWELDELTENDAFEYYLPEFRAFSRKAKDYWEARAAHEKVIEEKRLRERAAEFGITDIRTMRLLEDMLKQINTLTQSVVELKFK